MVEIKNYKYVCKNIKGKVFKGTIEAPNETIAREVLIDKGLKIEEIEEYSTLFTKLDKIQLGSSIKLADIVFYLKQMSSLIKSGMRIPEASQTLASQATNKEFRRTLFKIYFEVQSGIILSEALQKYDEFPDILVKMISIGEQTGEMIEVLQDTANYYEKKLKMSKAIKKALMGPLIYVFVGVGVTVAMLLFIFPIYVDMLGDNIDKSPMISKIFLNASTFLREDFLALEKTIPSPDNPDIMITVEGTYLGIRNFFILDGTDGISVDITYKTFIPIVGGIFTLMYLRRKYRNTYKYKLVKSTIALKMPLMSSVLKLSNVSTISSTIAQLSKNKIDMVQALRITKDITANYVYKEILDDAIKYVLDGENASLAFENHWAVEEMVPKMFKIGEKSGDIETMLVSLANYFTENSDEKFETIQKRITPIVMMCVYALIGMLMIAMMLPTITTISNIES